MKIRRKRNSNENSFSPNSSQPSIMRSRSWGELQAKSTEDYSSQPEVMPSAKTIQAKSNYTLGAPGTAQEIDADKTAEIVTAKINAPETVRQQQEDEQLQLKSETIQRHTDEDKVQMKPLHGYLQRLARGENNTLEIQRNTDKDEVQMKPLNGYLQRLARGDTAYTTLRDRQSDSSHEIQRSPQNGTTPIRTSSTSNSIIQRNLYTSTQVKKLCGSPKWNIGMGKWKKKRSQDYKALLNQIDEWHNNVSQDNPLNRWRYLHSLQQQVTAFKTKKEEIEQNNDKEDKDRKKRIDGMESLIKNIDSERKSLSTEPEVQRVLGMAQTADQLVKNSQGITWESSDFEEGLPASDLESANKYTFSSWVKQLLDDNSFGWQRPEKISPSELNAANCWEGIIITAVLTGLIDYKWIKKAYGQVQQVYKSDLNKLTEKLYQQEEEKAKKKQDEYLKELEMDSSDPAAEEMKEAALNYTKFEIYVKEQASEEAKKQMSGLATAKISRAELMKSLNFEQAKALNGKAGGTLKELPSTGDILFCMESDEPVHVAMAQDDNGKVFQLWTKAEELKGQGQQDEKAQETEGSFHHTQLGVLAKKYKVLAAPNPFV